MYVEASHQGEHFYYAPFRVQFIEKQLVVTDYPDPADEYKARIGLEIGDVITHINGKSIESIVDSLKIYYPASNEVTQLRDMARDLLRSRDNNLSLTCKSSQQVFQKVIPLYSMYGWERNTKNWYRPGCVYRTDHSGD